MIYRAAAVLAFLLALAGCEAGPGGKVPAFPVTVSESAPPVTPPARPAGLVAGGAAETLPDPAPTAVPAGEAAATGTTEEAPAAADAGAEGAADPTPKSAAQIACERKKGRYATWGETGAMVCFTTPRDAGKACQKASDCSTACLARSRSCAPLEPLYGCNAVLTEFGEAVTQCVE